MVHGFCLLRREVLLGALACVTAVGLAIPTTAAAHATSLTSCQVIAAPGSYRLDADVTATANTRICFAIAASGVKLHLNGHTIRGSDIPSVGIDASTGLTSDEVLGPGTITGWQRAGVIFGASSLQSKGAVRGVLATNNAVGIEITGGEGTAVHGNVARDNKFGIVVRHGANNNRIEGNIALNNTNTDLSDHNPNCGDNVWRGNDFGTAFASPSPSCID
jgi:parallel beta-helix repeat protein